MAQEAWTYSFHPVGLLSSIIDPPFSSLAASADAGHCSICLEGKEVNAALIGNWLSIIAAYLSAVVTNKRRRNYLCGQRIGLRS